MSLNESIVEDAALGWFGEHGYAVGHGPHLAPGERAAERDSFGDVVLVGSLREANTGGGLETVLQVVIDLEAKHAADHRAINNRPAATVGRVHSPGRRSASPAPSSLPGFPGPAPRIR